MFLSRYGERIRRFSSVNLKAMFSFSKSRNRSTLRHEPANIRSLLRKPIAIKTFCHLRAPTDRSNAGIPSVTSRILFRFIFQYIVNVDKCEFSKLKIYYVSWLNWFRVVINLFSAGESVLDFSKTYGIFFVISINMMQALEWWFYQFCFRKLRQKNMYKMEHLTECEWFNDENRRCISR